MGIRLSNFASVRWGIAACRSFLVGLVRTEAELDHWQVRSRAEAAEAGGSLTEAAAEQRRRSRRHSGGHQGQIGHLADVAELADGGALRLACEPSLPPSCELSIPCESP